MVYRFNKMKLQENIRRILREEDKYDDKVGKTFWFEYHCYESPESCDAEIWYRSHQKVKVIGVSEWSYDDKEWRQEDGNPRVYLVEWEDGFQYDVFEDELMESPNEFYRPSPPKRKIQESIRRILRKELNNRGDCNIMYDPEQLSKLDRFSNLWDMVVNEIDELIEVSQLEKELLPKDITVYSVQEKFDIEYVKRMDDERYNKSDISLFKYKNKLYIIDGHHRLCYDRINNRDSYVYIFDKDDSQIVDCIFYGIGDC